MLHDIYAFGVVLLEIGLWQSFIRSTCKVPLYINGRLLKAETQRPLWIFNNRVPGSPSHMQATLVAAARQLLPFAMGELYTEVFVSCLTCMDGEKARVSVQGAKFIEQVLDQLDDIRT